MVTFRHIYGIEMLRTVYLHVHTVNIWVHIVEYTSIFLLYILIWQ